MRHWIAWNPAEVTAYRGTTEVEAKSAVTMLVGMKGSWTRCKANGWRLSPVEGPDPAPAPEPVAPIRKAKAR